jgi:hypothetical protein
MCQGVNFLSIFRIGKIIFSCYAQEYEKQSKLFE